MTTTAQLTGKKTIQKTADNGCLFLDIGGVLLTNGWDSVIEKD
jgi:hypothetical protein